MAWDISRPVPWQRLIREWVVYALIMTVVLLLLFNNGSIIGAIGGVLVSGPLYLGFGWVLAKFGYQRKTLKELRTPRAESSPTSSSKTASNASDTERRPVAPSSRTASGANRPTSKRRRRR